MWYVIEIEGAMPPILDLFLFHLHSESFAWYIISLVKSSCTLEVRSVALHPSMTFPSPLHILNGVLVLVSAVDIITASDFPPMIQTADTN
jgi:hypothetical protein